MRVLVAGATGVIGRQLVPLLTAVGHTVIALAHSERRVAAIRGAGGAVVIADALDRPALDRAVRQAAPESIVNLLTAIPAELNPKRLAQDFALTNRLRTEGTRNLLAAAQAVGATRLITEGIAYAYEPAGTGLATEDAPFWQQPPAQFASVLAALRELEARTAAAGGLVLRFGHLYGPGSIYAADGSFIKQVRAGQVPLVGGGTATFSFTHAHDAATAIVAALDKGRAGALNIVDDEPAPMHRWLPVLAGQLGAPQPKTVPAWLARLAVGGWGVAYMTRLRGADNARAQAALDWRPRYPSWRTGFASEVGTTVSKGLTR